MNQKQASLKVLKDSQKETFPYTFNAMGIEIEIHEGVFSSKHFNGWKTFTKNFHNPKDKTILEIGCGPGTTSLHLAKKGAKKVIAVDINKKAVENTKANIKKLKLKNMQTLHSDMFENIKEKFDIIYWNMPFMCVEKDYTYKNDLERGLFDPDYNLLKKLLKQATKHLKKEGYILLGTGCSADIKKTINLIKQYNYKAELIAKEKSTEINPVEFYMYKLIPKIKDKEHQ